MASTKCFVCDFRQIVLQSRCMGGHEATGHQETTVSQSVIKQIAKGPWQVQACCKKRDTHGRQPIEQTDRLTGARSPEHSQHNTTHTRKARARNKLRPCACGFVQRVYDSVSFGKKCKARVVQRIVRGSSVCSQLVAHWQTCCVQATDPLIY